MNFQKKLLSFFFYYIYKFLNKINLNKKDTLRVLMYHDIKKNEYEKVDKQIKLFKQDNWNFLTPEDFLKFKLRKKKNKRKKFIDNF